MTSRSPPDVPRGVPSAADRGSLNGATHLGYSLSVDEVNTSIGSGGVVPVANASIFYNVTYDPTLNGFYSVVSSVGESEPCWCYPIATFHPPPPGTYLFGVSASTGGWAANWTVLSINVSDQDGSQTILSSGSAPHAHATVSVGGLASPVYNSATGALELLPTPATRSDGIALFPIYYPGGSITLSVVANYSQDVMAPLDGLSTLFFVGQNLVNTTGFPPALVSATASNSSMPLINRQGAYSSKLPFPCSTTPYFAVQWDPGWGIIGGVVEEMDVYVVDPNGSYLSTLGSFPGNATVGNLLWLSANLSTPASGVTFSYQGLPPGCVSEDLALLSCTPTATGSFLIRVYANDSFGDSATTTRVVSVTTPHAPPTSSCSGWSCGAVPLEVIVAAAVIAIILAAAIEFHRKRSHAKGEGSPPMGGRSQGPGASTSTSEGGAPAGASEPER